MIARSIRQFDGKEILWGLLGGLCFVFVFHLAYSGMDPALYEDRDDGVITMSHARNLVDHGFIGVEPSGQRVEGYSAPLQFWLYAILYALTGLHWHAYAVMQTWACTFALGWMVFGLQRGPNWQRLGWGLAVAVLLSFFPRFLSWHGSGMENPLLHLGIATILWMGRKALDTGSFPLPWAMVLAAVMLVRLDTVFHVLPLLLALALAYRWEQHSWRGLGVVALATGLWGLYQGWRWWYFGSLQPNTGLAQQISLGHNLERLLQGEDNWLRTGASLGWVGMRTHGAWLMPLLLLPLLWARLNLGAKWVVFCCMAMVVTAFLNPLVFGMTRLDTTRTVTFVSLAVALAWATTISRLQIRQEPLAALGIAAAIVPSLLLWPMFSEPNPRLCCAVNEYSALRDSALHYSESNGLPRLTVANPDLGKLSWGKDFNLLDMGFLGSPILSHLRGEEDWVRDYFFDFALPDVVELHGEWCLLHARILADPRFGITYTPLRATRVDYLETYGGDWPQVQEGVFVRKDLMKGSTSPEYHLIQALQLNLDLKTIQDALTAAIRPQDPLAHQWVTRTAYRFLPEFRAAGLGDELLATFAQTPSAAYDQALLGSASNRAWCAQALAWLRPHLATRWGRKFGAEAGSRMPRVLMEQGRIRIYEGEGRRLWLSLYAPTEDELRSLWFVHVYARMGQDVSHPNPWNAEFIEFSWDPGCAIQSGPEYLMPIELPRFPIKAILVGRSLAGQVAWSRHLVWPYGWL